MGWGDWKGLGEAFMILREEGRKEACISYLLL